MTKKNIIEVAGSVSDSFESLKQLFMTQMNRYKESNAQLCVYHRGEVVVDLWTQNKDFPSFNGDSLITIFSSGKSIESIALAYLVSRGRLKYEDPISLHWPEFARNNKSRFTVADLMRHEVGLANLDRSVDLDDLLTPNIKKNLIGKILEEQHPNIHRDGVPDREYHSLTRGLIVNELFRRVDSDRRTLGEFVEQVFRTNLGADVYIGLKEPEYTRMVSLVPLSIKYQLFQSLLPLNWGRKVHHNFIDLSSRLFKVLLRLRKERLNSNIPRPFNHLSPLNFFQHPDFPKCEISSANATCSARGLAKLAAMMSARGKFQDTQYLSEEAWAGLHSKPVKRSFRGGLINTYFTQGGVEPFSHRHILSSKIERDFHTGREGFYGWMGIGGSIFQWHPRLDIGFAFIPTTMHTVDFLNERGKIFQAEVLKCAELADF